MAWNDIMYMYTLTLIIINHRRKFGALVQYIECYECLYMIAIGGPEGEGGEGRGRWRGGREGKWKGEGGERKGKGRWKERVRKVEEGMRGERGRREKKNIKDQSFGASNKPLVPKLDHMFPS